MEYRPLNITVISAEGLKDVNLFSKMDVYAEVSIAGYPQSKKKTGVDKNCGTNPKWNHKMEFIVDEPYLTKPGLSLLFQLKAEGSIGSDKEVGSATVPVHDLYGKEDNKHSSSDKVVEYQLHTPSGKPKGSLKFSYRFGEKFTEETKATQPVTVYPAGTGSGYPPPGMAYPNQPPPPAAAGYGGGPPPPPPQAGGYYPNYGPPPPGYGYPPAAAGSSGYGGYQQPPPPGYGYAAQPQKPKKNKMGGMGAGLGLGLGAGLLGGLLVGEVANDIGDAAAYADGYDDAMGDMGGGFDF